MTDQGTWTDIEAALKRGATVVTGNARSARRLHLEYGNRQAALGRRAWNTPGILDWNSWLGQLWQDWSFQHDAPLRLTPMQELELWMEAQQNDAALVFSPVALAGLAADAYALLSAAQAHSSRNHYWQESDAERFRQWAAAFDRQCTRRGWISASRTTDRLIAAVLAGELATPAELVLTGFDRMTAAQNALLDAMQERGCQIATIAPARPSHTAKARLADSRAEVLACAHWVRQTLEANPSSRIGVLCADVLSMRGAIDRVFRHVLMPQSDSILHTAGRAPYEFSLGNPLATQPVVHAALLLLRWMAEPLAHADLTWLLLSGFPGAEQERIAFAQIDARWGRGNNLAPQTSLEQATASLKDRSSVAGMHRRLRSLVDFAATHRFSSETRTISGWAELARLALERCGWPGEQSADSVRFQAQRRWDRLLDEVALLDLVTASVTYPDFLARLQAAAGDTLFAPESLDAPVQIMGPMESAGQEFDAVWLLGATDQQWPMQGAPHPLLPLEVQRAALMPHATKQDDWDLAQRVTHRILASAGEVVISWPERNSDGELRPSPLLDSLEERQFVSDTDIFGPPAELEPFRDEIVVPFPAGESSGGAALLRDQAACPFRAFASHRLGASAPEDPEWGLTAAQRGSLLHEVLRSFWDVPNDAPRRGLPYLQHLIGSRQLRETLRNHIRSAFADLEARHAADTWMRAYLASEQKRLERRLEEWLRLEADRRPFVVEACERELTSVAIGSLRLKLRVDRIDQFEDGSRALLDYKTGAVSTSKWKDDRPDEPQLPLYAAYGGLDGISGVLFAQIRAGETGFCGHVRDASTQLFEDTKSISAIVKNPYQDKMRDGWAQVLAALADEFAQGEARVTPKRGAETCQYCPMANLCRIHERNAFEGATEIEDEHE